MNEMLALPRDLELQPGHTVADALDWLTPPEPPTGMVWEPDVVYGTAGSGGRDLTLHLYRPRDVAQSRPAVVFIHGGGWAGGDPLLHVRHAAHLAAHGYTAATISYRLVDEARWPAALEDAKCAVRWVRANAAAIGVDDTRIAVCGGSAGGHLSAMTALTPGLFEGSGGNETVPSYVSAALLLYPMTDMRAPGGEFGIQDVVHNFLGGSTDALYAESSPQSYVARSAPPIRTITGSEDPITPLPMIREFHRRLDEAGPPNDLLVYEGAGHMFDVLEQYAQRCMQDMLEFFDRHLKPDPST